MPMKYDVFICHASEDKSGFVRPLAEKLSKLHLEVWYDEFSLTIGDSLTQKIDEGLKESKYGIVVLSKAFFQKPWAKRELISLSQRELYEKEDIILPIWHDIDIDEVIQFSPSLADKKAGSSKDGINVLIRDLMKKIKPDASPLIVARDHLLDLNVDVPPISDEWWLDIIEYKEFLKFPDINADKRWIFLLPYPNEDHGAKRGHNIASTALQLDWSFEGESLNISQLTHPDMVHDFIHRWPGLYDCALANPGVLAMYVPQLTIPGFDSGFEDVFDNLLKPGNKEADRIFTYGGHDTIDGKEPLCGDIIALRHPSFGNYTNQELGHWYFSAHDLHYVRLEIGIFEGLIWLLSIDSSWLPSDYKNALVDGICSRDRWADVPNEYENDFILALYSKTRKQFRITKTIRDSLSTLVNDSLNKLGVDQKPESIVEQLFDLGLIDRYYDYREKIEARRRK